MTSWSALSDLSEMKKSSIEMYIIKAGLYVLRNLSIYTLAEVTHQYYRGRPATESKGRIGCANFVPMQRLMSRSKQSCCGSDTKPDDLFLKTAWKSQSPDQLFTLQTSLTASRSFTSNAND